MAEKKTVTGDDLQKGLDRLEEFTKSDHPASRKDELLAKANEGDLEKAERDELFRLLGGAPADAETEQASSVSDDLVKSMADEITADAQEALDVSPYLRDQHAALTKSMEVLGNHIEQSDRRHHEHSMLQSQALLEIGGLVKSMGQRLGVIETQPVRGPKSKGVSTEPGQTLVKSFEGGGDSDEISKGEISDALDGMMMESMEAGRNGLTKSGGDILVEISKFEQLSKLSPAMYGEVKGFLGRKNAGN